MGWDWIESDELHCTVDDDDDDDRWVKWANRGAD
jgi:hypothetical protein